MQTRVVEHMVTCSVGSVHHVHERDDSIEAPDSAQVQVLNSLFKVIYVSN